MNRPSPVYAKLRPECADRYRSVDRKTWFRVLRSEESGVWVDLDLTLSGKREHFILWPDIETQDG